jgi:peroxiredoxin
MSGSRLTGYAAAVAVLAIAAWLLWPSARPMPDVSFNLIDGRTLSSSELRGKGLLINFWSVSCEVCLRDMPRLTRLHQSLADRDFMVIGVALPSDPPPAVIGVTERLEARYPIAVDVHGEVNAAFGGVDTTPTSYLIDRSGNIRLVERGPLDETRMRATILTF